MDNLTIDFDPKIPREQIPGHRAFQFINALEMVFRNSVFQNNQNYLLVNFANIPRNPFYNQIIEAYLTFDNITVLNNSGAYYDKNTPYFSLFVIYSPMKPVNVLFNNSYFYNNTNCIYLTS